METPSFETTTQVFVGNHSMNIHIMSRLVSICQVLCITQLNDSFQGVGEPPKKEGHLGV
jgi:hypothetical protein